MTSWGTRQLVYSDSHYEPNTYEGHTRNISMTIQNFFLNVIGFSVSPLLSAVRRGGKCSNSDISLVRLSKKEV